MEKRDKDEVYYNVYLDSDSTINHFITGTSIYNGKFCGCIIRTVHDCTYFKLRNSDAIVIIPNRWIKFMAPYRVVECEVLSESLKYAEPPKEVNRECYRCRFYSYEEFSQTCKECKDRSNYKPVSQEEKKKIKKALGFWGGFDERIANDAIITLNQLVDAVNELRGAEWQ